MGTPFLFQCLDINQHFGEVLENMTQASIICDVAALTGEEPAVSTSRYLWHILESVQSYAPIRVNFTAHDVNKIKTCPKKQQEFDEPINKHG